MYRRIALALGLLAVLAGAPAAAQQAYPNRPIRLVIPFPAGGNVDVFSRVLFRQVEAELGATFVIDNRGGANGIVGADTVRSAAPDGYTVMNTSFGFAVNTAIVKKLPFDVIRDFTPITNVATGLGYLLVVHPGVAAKNTAELLEVARRQSLRYSTAGVGNGQHLAGALLASMTKTELLHVPYKGGGPAMTAVVGGEVQIHFPAASVGLPHAKAGRVRALAFTGAKRLATMPDLPTIGETVPGYVADAGWHGMFGPARLPMAIATRLQQAVHRALQEPKVHAHFVDNGYEPNGDPPEVWAAKFRDDVKKFAAIARAAGIEPQ
jgi:tripartite-type tricarboxylate transporter receptor subunit TctC